MKQITRNEAENIIFNDVEDWSLINLVAFVQEEIERGFKEMSNEDLARHAGFIEGDEEKYEVEGE